MTTTDLVESTDPSKLGASEMCDICGHTAAAHDHVASRFCKATMMNALSRGCICR